MPTRLFAVLLLVFATATSPAWAEWGGKGSFSPIFMAGENGLPLKLMWKYRVNRGEPIYFNETVNGLPIMLKLQLSDLTLTVNPHTQKRTVSVLATVSGAAQGTIALRIKESLQLNSAGKILITDQTVSLVGDLEAIGSKISLIARLLSQFTPSSEWFLDRNDLDELETDFVYDEQGLVTATIGGRICLTTNVAQCQNVNTPEVQSPEQWQIMGKIDELKVRNVVYANLVKVNRNTVIPDFQGLVNNSLNTEPITVNYWVAKGIGMVKGFGQYRFLGKPLLMELNSTNIPLPKIAKVKPLLSDSAPVLHIAGKGFGKISGQVLIDGQTVNITRWAKSKIQTEWPAELTSGPHTLEVINNYGVESRTSRFNLPIELSE